MTTKIFWSGDSQVVRLPKGFRFADDAEEVVIRRDGDRIILEPLSATEWPAEFWTAFDGMPANFERPPQVEADREELSI